MSGKSGLGSMPILPQNLLAAKEENPKVFVARIVYVLVYLALLALFIAYAIVSLIEFLDAQDNPATNNNVKGKEKIDYPVFAVCPYFGEGYKIRQEDVEIGRCGSLPKEDDPLCGKKKKKKEQIKTKDLEKKVSVCEKNKVEQFFPTFDNSQPEDYKTYGCIFLNLDKPYDESIEKKIISDELCEGKKPISGKKKGKDVETAYAKGIGYHDRYQFDIHADRSAEVQTWSLTVKPGIEDFDIRTAEDAGNGFPEGSHIAVFLEKITFKCEGCDDDKVETYFNSTVNILSIDNGNGDRSTTRVEVYYDGLTVTELEEVITTTTLDYLGNFAGMLGTLLGFAVINYLDRLLCYFIIGHGGMASVWDEFNQ